MKLHRLSRSNRLAVTNLRYDSTQESRQPINIGSTVETKMEDTSVLVWGTLFGGIGIGFFIYGKKQKNPVAYFTGISLFVIPYFITDTLFLIAACVAVIALPFFVKV